MGKISDPFAEARRDRGVLGLPTDREVIPLILGHEGVRKAAGRSPGRSCSASPT